MFLEWENNSGKLKIISGKFQNSRKFQNNAINEVKQISLSHVIISFNFVRKLSQLWSLGSCSVKFVYIFFWFDGMKLGFFHHTHFFKHLLTFWLWV